MKAAEIRAQAREALSGNWITFILLNVMYMLAISILMLIDVFIPIIGAIVCTVFAVPLAFSYSKNLIRLKRKETDSSFEFFKGIFSNFGRAWRVAGRTLLKLLLPIIVVFVIAITVAVVSTIAVVTSSMSTGAYLAITLLEMIMLIIAYFYMFARVLLYILPTYIAIDNPQMSAKDCVNMSATLMKGNRWKYIFLSLSFIGWYILSVCTLGLGFIFLLPYVSVAFVCFYEVLASKKQSDAVENSSDESDKVNIVQKSEEESNEVETIQERNVVEDGTDSKDSVTNADENNNPIKQ